MTTRQIKTFFVNTSTSNLTTSTGSKADTPSFFYKSQTLIRWHINDSSKTGIDLTGASFEFVIAEDYNATPLVTVSNASFVLADWTASDITTGKICCRVDFNVAGILTYIDDDAEENAYCSLWATIAGTNYLLTAFICKLKNLIH